jgi:hypothetical protein
MARDLYGEMLSRALNRGAPQGHFAAYIQPNEAAMLRSQGGGVAPGGDQYMANGVPSFQRDDYTGLGALAGPPQPEKAAEGYERDPDFRAPLTPVSRELTFGPGTINKNALQDLISDIRYEENRGGQEASPAYTGLGALARMPPTPLAVPPAAPAPQSNLDFQYRTRFSPEPIPQAGASATEISKFVGDVAGDTPWGDKALDQFERAREAQKASKGGDFRTQQNANLWVALLDPDKTPDELAETLNRPISEEGTGRFSPAAVLSKQKGVSITDIANVMQRSPSGYGYAINDPASDVSVPQGFNMGWIPSLAGTIAGAMWPPMAAALWARDWPTAGQRARQAILGDRRVGGLGEAFRNFSGEVGGRFARAGVPLGNFLQGLVPGGRDPQQQQEFEQPSDPQVLPGQPSPVTPLPLAGDQVTPPTGSNTFVPDFVPDFVPEDILRLVEDTAAHGRGRLEKSREGLPEGAFGFGDPSWAQYRGGYFREYPPGSGQYHPVGPPGTFSVAKVYRRDQIPEGSLIAPPDTQFSGRDFYEAVFGVPLPGPLEKQLAGLA